MKGRIDMKRIDNRIVVNLSSVQWARFGYRNQYGAWRNKLPENGLTYRSQPILTSSLMFNPTMDRPKLVLDWLKDNNMLDIWQPELYLKLTANESLVYTGEKAKSIWKAWNEKIFKKK